MRSILALIVFVVWALLGLKMCQDRKACCGDVVIDDSEVIVEPPTKPAECPDVPICFKTGEASATLGGAFNSLRDSVINIVKEGQNLRIIGTYASSEPNETSFENLGIARAEAIKSEFIKLFDGSRIETSGQLTVGGDIGDYSIGRIRFSIVGEEAEPIASTTFMYFPYNSTERLEDAEIDAYLDRVVQRVKASGQRIRITGHTDSDGSPESNMALGLQRAEVIRNQLISKGLAAGQIIVESRGETRPVSSNATDAGRAQNRRTELEIIK